MPFFELGPDGFPRASVQVGKGGDRADPDVRLDQAPTFVGDKAERGPSARTSLMAYGGAARARGIGMDSEGEDLALADAIELVRAQLMEAVKRGHGSALAFDAGPVELEFEISFERTGSLESGVRLWVVNVGGKGAMTHARTQRVRITLQPLDRATRQRSLVSDEGTE